MEENAQAGLGGGKDTCRREGVLLRRKQDESRSTDVRAGIRWDLSAGRPTGLVLRPGAGGLLMWGEAGKSSRHWAQGGAASVSVFTVL